MRTACARLSDAWFVVGMVTVEWTRSRMSFGRPLSSRPKASATFPPGAASCNSAAATLGSMSRSFAARRRAVKPTTRTQSATAASNESKCSIRSIRSIVPCAIPSSRTTSYSTGRTNRNRLTPMFFMARIVAPMLTGSCGSYNTTATDARSESGIDDLQRNESGRIVPIAAQVHKFIASAAEYELAAASLSAERHLIHDDFDRKRRLGLSHVDRQAIAGTDSSPSRRYAIEG